MLLVQLHVHALDALGNELVGRAVCCLPQQPGLGYSHCNVIAVVRLQVTDASGSSLASHCPSLAAVKLTKAMTDSTIKQLAQSCPLLQEADLHR